MSFLEQNRCSNAAEICSCITNGWICRRAPERASVSVMGYSGVSRNGHFWRLLLVSLNRDAESDDNHDERLERQCLLFLLFGGQRQAGQYLCVCTFAYMRGPGPSSALKPRPWPWPLGFLNPPLDTRAAYCASMIRRFLDSELV